MFLVTNENMGLCLYMVIIKMTSHKGKSTKKNLKKNFFNNGDLLFNIFSRCSSNSEGLGKTVLTLFVLLFLTIFLSTASNKKKQFYNHPSTHTFTYPCNHSPIHVCLAYIDSSRYIANNAYFLFYFF